MRVLQISGSLSASQHRNTKRIVKQFSYENTLKKSVATPLQHRNTLATLKRRPLFRTWSIFSGLCVDTRGLFNCVKCTNGCTKSVPIYLYSVPISVVIGSNLKNHFPYETRAFRNIERWPVKPEVTSSSLVRPATIKSPFFLKYKGIWAFFIAFLIKNQAPSTHKPDFNF